MANTKTISAEAARGHHTFSLTVTETATSNTANTSTLSFALKIVPEHESYQWYDEGTSISYSVVINGATLASGYIPDYDGSSKTIASGSGIMVAHNVGGAKSINISFAVNDRDEESYTCGDASASGTFALTTINIASYALSISAATGSTITVNRTSSPKKGAATGRLTNGAAIYYDDVLEILFDAASGYEIVTHTVNGSAFTSGGTHRVTAGVAVAATARPLGLAYVFNGSVYVKCFIYIFDGTGWRIVAPYRRKNGTWNLLT